MRLAVLKYVSICFLFFSCASYRSVQKGSYDIRIMSSGCCGCMAYYYNVYEGKRLTEQFIVETFCNGWVPTKLFFIYNEKGKIIETKTYVAVYDSSFSIPLSASDKLILPKLDDYYKAHKRAGDIEINVLNIKGFIKPIGSNAMNVFRRIDK